MDGLSACSHNRKQDGLTPCRIRDVDLLVLRELVKPSDEERGQVVCTCTGKGLHAGRFAIEISTDLLLVLKSIPDNPLLVDGLRSFTEYELLSGVREGRKTGNRKILVVPVRFLQLLRSL